MEPATLHNFFGFFRHIVVAEHDDITLHADLALTIFVRIIDFDLNFRECLTGTSCTVVVTAVNTDNGGTFGNAVAVQNLNTVGIKAVYDLLIDGRTARNDKIKLAAETISDRRKTFVTQADTERIERLADLIKRTKNPLFTALFNLGNDTLVHLFYDHGNDSKICRFEIVNQIHHVFE